MLAPPALQINLGGTLWRQNCPSALSLCTCPTARSPICASAWRARAFPTSRRSSRGRTGTSRRIPAASWSRYWRDGFDWRAQEARINALRQFTVPLARHRAAFHPRAGPWAGPDAAAAFARLAGLDLRVPQAIPAARREHFTVVAPSLPGYTLSFTPGQQRFGVEEIADLLRRADDRRARLRALRRAGRRLGRLRRLALGRAAIRSA